MFGFHDNDRCAFDLWSPYDSADHKGGDEHADSSFYSTLYGRDNYCAIENRAFSAYAKHEQEIEDIVNAICNGKTDFQLDDYMSDSDLQSIKDKVYNRTGMIVNFN